MKKRLFITSALMTAVMAASLATGTYAWYAATGSGGISSTTAEGTVATVDPTIDLTGNIAVTAKVAEVSAGSKLCLAEWVDGSPKGTFKTYYLNSNKEEVEYDYTKKSQVVSKAYKVNVTIPKGVSDKSPDPIEFAKNVSALLGKTITISVKADDDGVGKANRTKVWASETSLVDGCDFSSKQSVPFTFPNTSEAFKTTDTITVAYVAVYVDGNKESDGKNVADEAVAGVSGNFTVTIANG